jgi:hypothetical protein
MKKYCQSCGKPNPANAKFCCSCGTSMNPQAKSTKQKAVSRREVIDDDDDHEEEEDQAISINASQLDVDISYNDPVAKETIGDIMASGPESHGEPYERGGGPTISKEEFLKEFQREAGPLRKGPSIGER